MTTNELAEVAGKLWKANEKNAETIAKQLFVKRSIPPIVAHLDGMAAFFADLQKQSFILGALSVLCIADAEDAPHEVVH